MTTQSISLSTPNPHVEIKRVGGALRINGWEKQEVEVTGEAVDLSREGEALTLSASVDATLKIPGGATLRVDYVGGKLAIGGMQGSIEIAFVGSDLDLRDLTGQVRLRGFAGGATRMENVSHFEAATEARGNSKTQDSGSWTKADKILGRAEEKRRNVEKKILQAEGKLQRMRAGIGRAGARWQWASSTRSGQQPAEGGSAATEEERLKILRMLQEKKLTAAEADRLLGALEGES